MKKLLGLAILAALAVGLFRYSQFSPVNAQDGPRQRQNGPPPQDGPPPGQGGPPGLFGGGPPPQAGPTIELIEQFDKDKNGRLEGEELKLALAEARDNGPPGRGPRGGGGPAIETKPGRKVSREEATAYSDRDLYDQSIMRTVFIDIDSETWEKDMGTLKDYGVDIAADVTVDNKTYPNVGIRFRGNSSFFTVSEGQKRSLNLSFDWADKDQDLYGYRTLNLLNSHSDESYVRLVLYSEIARNYTAVPKASYVHVVINGESWGVYINEQQFNSDFTKEYFGSRGGRRWKSPPGRGGTSFAYQGDAPKSYAGYELKTKDNPEAWAALINATKIIADAKPDEFEKVDEAMSIDRILWFLAVDNVLLDMDGYYQRGADYAIYQEPMFERFHILPYDNNETFRAQGAHGPGFGTGGGGGRGPGGAGGPGGRGGRGGRGGFGPPGGGPPGRGGPPRGGPPGGGPPGGGPPGEMAGGEQKAPFDLDIFHGIDQPLAPFINKLFQNPDVKARYVAHVRTIYKQWIDWNTVSPLIEEYRDLIDGEIKLDTRKLTTNKAYKDSLGMSKSQGRGQSPGLKAFFKGRKAYLDKVDELKQPFPKFKSIDAANSISNGKITVEVTAQLEASKASPEKVFVYFAPHRLAKFQKLEMKQVGENFVAQIPDQTIGGKLYYYCEARTADKFKTTSFYPVFAEGNPKSLSLAPPVSSTSSIAINEIMAAAGDGPDWIELKNKTDSEFDLSGMYLTDDKKDLLKWQFPAGTTVKPNGFVVVWADKAASEDAVKDSKLHASFKLSNSGETIMLLDTEKRNHAVLDEVKFAKQVEQTAFARLESEKWQPSEPTPGRSNE